MEVVPLVADVLMRLGEELHRLASAVAALLPPRDAPLGALECHLGHTEDTRVGDWAPIGERGKGLQAKINPCLLTSRRQGRARHVGTKDGDIPAVGLPRDRHRLGRALQRAGPMDADAPEFVQDQGAVIQPGAVATLLEREAVKAGASLEAWEAGFLAALYPAKERLVGLVEAGEHVLEDVAVDGSIVRERGAHGLQFGRLVEARDGDMAPLPRGDALLQRGVVEIATAPEHCVQRLLLGGCRPQLLFVRLVRRVRRVRRAHGLWHGYTSRLPRCRAT